MRKYLRTRWGDQIENPTDEDLRNALDELERRDQEHPDCSLRTEEGWTIAVFESGLVVLENIETGDGPWHKRSADVQTALMMWKALLEDNLSGLKSNFEWEDGYG